MVDYVRKYPRTPHLPFSRSVTSDDITGTNWVFLQEGSEVVVTEKMDGECTTLYHDRFHARSMDSMYHPSRSWVANLWGNVRWQLPPWRRLVVENVYAEHSIRYDQLPTFAYGITVIDLLNDEGQGSMSGTPTVLAWDSILEVFSEVGITPVPTLYRGKTSLAHLRSLFKTLDTSRQEGLVVRTAGSFLEEDFGKNVGKAVRVGHVTTSEMWIKNWKPNSMAKTSVSNGN
jgi:hypothetical protein